MGIFAAFFAVFFSFLGLDSKGVENTWDKFWATPHVTNHAQPVPEESGLVPFAILVIGVASQKAARRMR